MASSSDVGHDLHARAGSDDSLGRVTVWQDLILAMHLLETALERQSQRVGGISHGHVKLLVLLSAADNQTLALKSLAETLRFSPSRISHALAAIERRGLVTRHPNANGRRASEARLTEEGGDLVREVLHAQRHEIRDHLFDRLGDIGTVALGDLSSQIVAFLDQDRGELTGP